MKKEDCVIGLKVKMVRRSTQGKRLRKEDQITGEITAIYPNYALVRVCTGNKNTGYNETFRFQELYPIQRDE